MYRALLHSRRIFIHDDLQYSSLSVLRFVESARHVRHPNSVSRDLCSEMSHYLLAAEEAEGVDDDEARGSGATEPKRTDGDGAAFAVADAAEDEEDEDDDDSADDMLSPRGSSRNEQPSESRWPVAGV